MTGERVPALEVESGPAAGTRLEVGDEPLEIGREANEEGRLGDDPQLSRRHARISAFKGGRLLVEDLGSTNGTSVNGEEIAAPTVLGPGDTLALGDSELRVVAARGGRAAPVHGGVHTLPPDLLGTLVSRAPVKRSWVVRAGLIAAPIVLAVNIAIRTMSVEVLDISTTIGSMQFPAVFCMSVMPTIGNCVGFYKSFGRPQNRSTASYLVPTFLVTLAVSILFLILLPSSAGLKEYLVTAVMGLVAPTVIVPALLALRVRAELTARREMGVAEAP
jgi:pSer/pThr/pTyr-binding forkhead associated (FHA) protein